MAAAKHVYRLFLLVPLMAVAACSDVSRSEDVPDPFEVQNRANLEANTKLFQSFGGKGEGNGFEVPVAVSQTVGNLAQNLRTPRIMVNDLLQGDGESLVHNGFRLVLNTTLGIGGVFDPASSFGLEPRDNDFGKTMFVWGMGPGNYVVAPIIGPSTERELAGKVVDSVLDPLGFVLPSTEKWYARGLKVGDKVVDGLKYGDTINSVLTESADPYLAAKSIYLQNRRFELTGGTVEDDYVDPYEDLYGN